MPFVESAGLKIHYSLTGDSAAPVVVLSNSLGTNFTMWDLQAPVLEKSFRLLRYDTRGHGRTAVTPSPYTIEQLGRDVLGLLDGLKLGRVNFCGLSMGGMIGQWLGVHAPERINRLVLCSTSPKIGALESWNARIEAIRKGGMNAVATAVVERWFTPEFRARAPQPAVALLGLLQSTPPEGYIACCEAIRDADLRDAVASIRAPVQVMMGARDPATPAADGRAMAQRIPGARYIELESSHLCNVESVERFNPELIGFLTAM
ncbi:MAG TPA: 3-oxoadipate enol-lactonase [Candidatus Acidoferrales bacterium]|nr:3-oxoadipate enol-lactonase [Candidatus Acidoferrales bacterium]